MHPMPALDGAVGCPTAINSQRVLTPWADSQIWVLCGHLQSTFRAMTYYLIVSFKRP